MKKIKLLTAVSTVAALGAIAPVAMTVTSCNKGGDTPTPTPVVKTLLNIDSNNVLHGFNPSLTKKQIEKLCKGTLTIPSTVVRIADYAFCDTVTGETLIPDSVTNLVFEENIDLEEDEEGNIVVTGYSKLNNDKNSEFPAIGYRAFMNAPITSLRLPVGSGYDVGYEAFAGSKIKHLEMPHPRYNTKEDIEDPTKIVGAEIEGAWRGFLQERATIGVIKYYEKHRVNIRSKAFYNTESLKSISMSWLVTMKQGDGSSKSQNVFKLANDKVSNVNYLDFAKFFPITYNHIDLSDKDKFQKMVDYNKEIISIETSKCFEQFSALSGQFYVGDPTFYSTFDKLFYVVFPDTWYQIDDKRDQRDYINLLLEAFGAPDITEGQLWDGYDPTFGNVLVFPSTYNFNKTTNSYQSKIDCLENRKSFNRDISLSSSKLKDQSIILPFRDGSGVVEKYGLKGDINFNITNVEWKTGTAVPLTIEQLKLEDIPPEEQATYTNNYGLVKWTTAPQDGDQVEITFDVDCVDMDRTTTGMKALITFKA